MKNINHSSENSVSENGSSRLRALVAALGIAAGSLGLSGTAHAAETKSNSPAVTAPSDNTEVTAPSAVSSPISPETVSFDERVKNTLAFTHAWGALDDVYDSILFPDMKKFLTDGVINNKAVKDQVAKDFATNQAGNADLNTKLIDGKKLMELLTELKGITGAERVIIREWKDADGNTKKYVDLDGLPAGFVDAVTQAVSKHVPNLEEQLRDWTSALAQRNLIPAEYDTVTFGVDFNKTKLPDVIKLLKSAQAFQLYAPAEEVKKVMPAGMSEEELQKIREEAEKAGYARAVSEGAGSSSGRDVTATTGPWSAFADVAIHGEDKTGDSNDVRYGRMGSLSVGGRFEAIGNSKINLAGEAGVQALQVTPTYEGPNPAGAESEILVTPFVGAALQSEVYRKGNVAIEPRVRGDVGYSFGHGLMVQGLAEIALKLQKFGINVGFGVHRQQIDKVLGQDWYGKDVKTETPAVTPMGKVGVDFNF